MRILTSSRATASLRPMENAQILLLTLPVLIFSIVLHEVAHGWVALRQGDNTAAMLGRITLNPIPHLDPVGSILVPGLLALSGSPAMLGWAKPVPTNPRNYRDYRRGDILVSLAGVAANLLLVLVFTLLAAATVWALRLAPGMAATWEILQTMFLYGIRINILLILFNLIPIPPLDGSHVLYHLLPPALGAKYRAVGGYGMVILFALLFFGGLRFLGPAVDAGTSLFLRLANVLV